MAKFPALTEMGVQSPEQIARFALYMVNNKDILRIIYDRKSGSILPVSKKFSFPRVKKSTLVDSGTRKTEIVYESTPSFRNALSELEEIMKTRKAPADIGKLIAEEVRLLEEEVAARTDYIKSLVQRIK
jgi:hypothetical protein